jgi:antitoxin component HigA of HigAB toxin-antitoxin module
MSAAIKVQKRASLPGSFEELVGMLAPMAIRDDVQHANTIEMIDRLMRIESLSKGQADYLETLVELVEAYEARHHAIDVSNVTGLRMLRHVVGESGMSGSDLARLLGMHPTMGSKMLKGQRRLTWDHAKILGRHFKVGAVVFMD